MTDTDPELIFDQPEPRWHRVVGWTHRITGGKLLLLGPDRQVVTLTGLVAAAWAVLDEPGSTSQVAERLADGHDLLAGPVDPEVLEEAIPHLVGSGILTDPEAGIVRLWGEADDGAVVEVVLARPVLSRLTDRWPPRGLRPANGPHAGPADVVARIGLGRDGLFVPDQGTAPSEAPDEVAWALLEQTLAAIAATRLHHLVAVHAAVFAWGGRAILVPATSGAGKSTLAVAAHAAGAKVLSDEYALVDPDTGLVTGWPRPVRVRTARGIDERLPLAEPSEPLPVAVVASLTYEAGGPNAWEPSDRSRTVLDLLANTLVARTRPDDALDAALAISRRAVCVHGSRGEADRAVAGLLDLLARSDGSA